VSSKSGKSAKTSGKSVKVASASKRSVKSKTQTVAGLMKSTRDLKRVASRASARKVYAATRTNARKAVTVASRDFAKTRRAERKSVVLASSANPYGAFVRSASFIN
jgi:rRNA maturation endonuclease Nob1